MTLDFESTYDLHVALIFVDIAAQLLPPQTLLIYHGQCTELCGAVAQ